MPGSATPLPPAPTRFQKGIKDLRAGLGNPQRWMVLGWHDFMLQHRRTIIGPFWQSIQIAVWVVGLTAIFGREMEDNIFKYMVYVSAGVVLWNFITSAVAGSSGVFLGNSGLIKGLNLPLSLHPLRFIFKHLARITFQLPVLFIVLPFGGNIWGPQLLWLIPALFLFVFTGLWVTLLLAILGARFRDLPLLIKTVMRFLFFASPVFWVPTEGIRMTLALINPFAHFMAIVREPLLGHAPTLLNWVVVLGISLPGSIASIVLFIRYRRSIVFWV